jgi:hypothetical protein
MSTKIHVCTKSKPFNPRRHKSGVEHKDAKPFTRDGKTLMQCPHCGTVFDNDP